MWSDGCVKVAFFGSTEPDIWWQLEEEQGSVMLYVPWQRKKKRHNLDSPTAFSLSVSLYIPT